MRPHRSLVLSLIVAGGSLLAGDLEAQKKGKGGGGGHGDHAVITVKTKQQKPKKVVIDDHTILVTREVLVKQGYQVVRIVPHRDDPDVRVVYYRRGSNGRGHGHGPTEMIIIRPTTERIVFESAPRSVLMDINVRLKL